MHHCAQVIQHNRFIMCVYRATEETELLLMRRAKACSSSCSQVVLVYEYIHPFRRSSLFCSQKSQKKITKTQYSEGSRSSILTLFKKLVANKQRVCAYRQPFSL